MSKKKLNGKVVKDKNNKTVSCFGKKKICASFFW